MGRVDPAHVIKALEMGADGVLVSGCHFEDCHYSFGAKNAAEQYKKIEKIVFMSNLSWHVNSAASMLFFFAKSISSTCGFFIFFKTPIIG